MIPDKNISYLNALRGVAVCGVVLSHIVYRTIDLHNELSIILSYGQLGVQLFFFISALTLCISFDRDQNLIFFYIKRFFRIAPLYYFAIFFYFLWENFKYSYHSNQILIISDYNLINILSNIFLLHGFYPYGNNNIVSGGWSIGAEVYFYILFPFLFFLVKKNKLVSNIFLLLFYILLIFFLRQFFLSEEFDKIVFRTFLQLIPFYAGLIFYFKFFNTLEKFNSILLLLLITLTSLIIMVLGGSIFIFEKKSFLMTSLMLVISSFSFFYIIGVFSNIRFFLKKKIKVHNFFKILYYKLFTFFVNLGICSYSVYVIHFFIRDIVIYLYKYFSIYKLLPAIIFVIILWVLIVLISYFIGKTTRNFIEVPGMNLGRFIIKKIKDFKYL
jgi:peptidoglycan/LPS O-acetylase OafA/YrhL